MSNIKKFHEFVNENKKESVISDKEIRQRYTELKRKGLKEINAEHKESGKQGSIDMSDVHDGNIADALKGEEKKEFNKLSKEMDKLMGFKVKENLDIETEDNYPHIYLVIADDIAKGFTNGIVNDKDGAEIAWDLEVNVKDWIKLDDEDIDFIADQIREGKTEGNDPLDWKLVLGGDSFEEEEEYYTRADVANELGVDADEFEDSTDLGDMADNVINDVEHYKLMKEDAEYFFEEFLKNNDISYLATSTISNKFNYNKVDSVFNKLMQYYPQFEDEYGYIENIETPEFEKIIKSIILNYLKDNNLSESKKKVSKK